MSMRRSRDRVERPRRGPAAAFAAVLTAIALAVTVHLANRASAVTADEHALARAQPCAGASAGAGASAAQNSGTRDCVADIAGVAVGPLQKVYKSAAVKLTVSSGSTQTTLTFPRGVGATFHRIQDGDFVALTTWRGNIVAVTAQGDTEATPAAPSEQYRSRLTATFYAAAFTVVLAGLTLLSAALTGWFRTDSSRGVGFFLAYVVIFAGFATAISAVVITGGGSLRAALVTAPSIVAAGLVVAGGVGLWRLVRRRRETERMLRELRAEMS